MFCVLITWGLQSAGISITPLPTALLALPAAILLTIALALMTDKLVFSYYRRQRSETVTYLIVSVGVMFFIGGLIRFIIGPDDRVFADGQRFLLKARTFKDATGLSEGLAIKTSQGVTIILAFVVVAALFWFLNRTKTGKSMRAYSDNEDLALLSGINPERVVMITWIITGALAALAGTLYGLDKSYKPFTYLSLLLPIFASAIVGGVGSPIGAIVGGYVIAFSELLVTFAYKKVISYLTFEQVVPEGLVQLLSTDYKIAVSFVILLIVLLIRPTGLFSGKTI
jgi:branched-chain amino acid transport system permease protein